MSLFRDGGFPFCFFSYGLGFAEDDHAFDANFQFDVLGEVELFEVDVHVEAYDDLPLPPVLLTNLFLQV